MCVCCVRLRAVWSAAVLGVVRCGVVHGCARVCLCVSALCLVAVYARGYFVCICIYSYMCVRMCMFVCGIPYAHAIVCLRGELQVVCKSIDWKFTTHGSADYRSARNEAAIDASPQAFSAGLRKFLKIQIQTVQTVYKPSYKLSGKRVQTVQTVSFKELF